MDIPGRAFHISVFIDNHNGLCGGHGFQSEIQGIAQVTGQSCVILSVDIPGEVILYIRTSQQVSGIF